MQVVIRQYSGRGAAALFDTLERRSAELQTLMRTVKGFVSYTLARTDTGGITVTLCQDKAGIEESVRKAKAWIDQNVAALDAAPPTVTAGKVVLHVTPNPDRY